jgi:hypothetical protein
MLESDQQMINPSLGRANGRLSHCNVTLSPGRRQLEQAAGRAHFAVSVTMRAQFARNVLLLEAMMRQPVVRALD